MLRKELIAWQLVSLGKERVTRYNCHSGQVDGLNIEWWPEQFILLFAPFVPSNILVERWAPITDRPHLLFVPFTVSSNGSMNVCVSVDVDVHRSFCLSLCVSLCHCQICSIDLGASWQRHSPFLWSIDECEEDTHKTNHLWHHKCHPR